jgi:hypothetical protein
MGSVASREFQAKGEEQAAAAQSEEAEPTLAKCRACPVRSQASEPQ